MTEQQPQAITRHLQKSLHPYIRPREEVSHIRRVLALHLQEAHRAETERDGASLPLALQELNHHFKPSCSRGLRKDYLKSLRANSKARKEYASISSEQVDQYQSSVSKHNSQGQDENPLDSYVLLLKQRQRLERLQVLARHLDNLDKKSPASQEFLDPKSVVEGIDPLPPIPSSVLYEEGTINKGSSTQGVTELVHKLERSVLQAKFILDKEKKRSSECKSRLSGIETTVHASSKRKLEALGRTRNEMILWMEEQLGKTGEDEEEEVEKPKSPRSKISTESQIIEIQKEYRKYVLVRQELLATKQRQLDGQESVSGNETIQRLEESQEAPIVDQQTNLLQPYLTELLAISNEQKSLTLLRSYLNTSLAKQQKESTLSMNRLAEESHLLPKYPMKAKQAQRLVERPDSLGGMLGVGERPDFISRARGWTFAADTAGNVTKEAVLEKVEEGRAFVDESLHTLLGLHQLLGYDIEEAEKDGDDIWAPDSKSSKKRENSDERTERVEESSRRDIWSTLDGNLGVIRK